MTEALGKSLAFLQGVKNGKLTKAAIRKNIESITNYAEEKGISREDLVQEAMKRELVLKENYPKMIDELKGIASGAEVPYIDVLILNVWEEKFFGE
jgi:hypothetical protein